MYEIVELGMKTEVIEPFWFGEEIVFTRDDETGVYLFPGEELKDIPGKFEGLYKASSRGEIYSLISNLWLKKNPVEGGYFQVHLYVNKIRYPIKVCRLIAMAFHGLPIKEKNVCRHKDNNRTNDHSYNLRWGTQSDNCEDKNEHGTHNKGIQHPLAQLTEDDVRDILIKGNTGKYTHDQLALEKNISRGQVTKILLRERWSHVTI